MGMNSTAGSEAGHPLSPGDEHEDRRGVDGMDEEERKAEPAAETSVGVRKPVPPPESRGYVRRRVAIIASRRE